MSFFIWRNRGFTLIEILIVVAVIGTLASVVVANVADGRKKARDASRISDIAQLQLAMRMHKDLYDSYPNVDVVDAGIDPDDPSDDVITSTRSVIGEGGDIDLQLAGYLSSAIVDVLGDPVDMTNTYEYVFDSAVTCGTETKKILYARSMELVNSSNWESICPGELAPGDNTYGVILR